MCAGLPRGSQDARGSRAVNQLQKQGRGMPKLSIRQSVAGGSRVRGTRDQLGYQPDNKACPPVSASCNLAHGSQQGQQPPVVSQARSVPI